MRYESSVHQAQVMCLWASHVSAKQPLIHKIGIMKPIPKIGLNFKFDNLNAMPKIVPDTKQCLAIIFSLTQPSAFICCVK